MKIIFVGGGTGGHFYPLIAVAEEIDRYAQENQLVQPKKYYFGPEKYDEKALYESGMTYVYCPAGKRRNMKDVKSKMQNILSSFFVLMGITKACINIFLIFPDVVFSKGGFASFPVLVAARIFGIPVVIHDSDALIGRVSKWSASFARYIGIAYPDAEKFFSEKEKKKVALVGIPLRVGVKYSHNEDAHTILKLEKDVPTILVLGGSSGAKYINENVLDALAHLLKKYQVVHQTGKQHIETVIKEAGTVLHDMKGLHTYRPFAFFNPYHLRAAYSVADIIITRAGSTTLFEIAAWGKPAIVIPIPEDVSRDQHANAYAYARETGARVIEQQNLTPNLLTFQVGEVCSSTKEHEDIARRSKRFARPDAAKKIAHILVDILKSHEG